MTKLNPSTSIPPASISRPASDSRPPAQRAEQAESGSSRSRMGAAVAGLAGEPPAKRPRGEATASSASSRGVSGAATEGATSAAQRAGPKDDTRPTGASAFEPAVADKLRKSDKVLVLEYSSTGGGHTDRSLQPIFAAVADGTLKKGDSVVILAPPRWPNDKQGNHVEKLHTRADQLKGQGFPSSNAFVEAMNGLLQQAKRAARGFRTASTFIAIAYLRMSRLKHLPPHPFASAPTN